MRLHGSLRLQRGGFLLVTGEFDFEADGVSAVFGPSGSGKTTFLRALAGLESATEGHLAFAGQPWLGPALRVPPERRRIGFVFQNAALFPHLSVRQNLQYAQQRAGNAAGRVDELAAQVGVVALLGRSVQELSGGEAQRVAIARALLSAPRLLCLDEPLSALDWKARGGLLDLIDQLAHETGLPMVYVTHSAAEVERLASRVLFMDAGRIVAVESFADALRQPASPLFEQDGPATVLEGRLENSSVAEEGAVFITAAGLQVRLPPQLAPQLGVNRSRLRILARDVGVATSRLEGVSIQNQLETRVAQLVSSAPGRVLLSLTAVTGELLYSEITRSSAERLQLQPGQTVFALVKSVVLVR